MAHNHCKGAPLSRCSPIARGIVVCTVIVCATMSVSAEADAGEPRGPLELVVTTANREQGRIEVAEEWDAATPERAPGPGQAEAAREHEGVPRRAAITVWNMYEAGLPSRARIAEIERTPVTESIRELHLWNLTEPMEWSILESFPNLEVLTITGMTFERGLLFDQGAPVEQLVIQESEGLGIAPTFSLARFPKLREFAYFVFDTEEIPLLQDVPPSLSRVTFLFSYEVELRSVPEALEVLHSAASVQEINVSPLRALPAVFRRVPELRDDLGAFQ